MNSTPLDLVELFEQSCAKHAPRRFLGRFKGGAWQWRTYDEVGKAVTQVRKGLRSLGLERGDRVAVISNNRDEWIEAVYASLGLRAVCVPLYESQTDAHWEAVLNDCGAKICFAATPPLAARVGGFKARVPSLAHLVCFENAEGFTTLAQLKEKGGDGAAEPADPEGLAMLIYTSGTTGRSRGVELTHRALCENANTACALFPQGPEGCSLAFLPWAHVAGACTELLTIVTRGMSTATVDRVEQILEALPQIKPTVLFAVPRIWNRIYAGLNEQMETKPAVIRALFRSAVAASRKKSTGQALGAGERLWLWLGDRLIFSKVRARFGGRVTYAISGSAALSPEVAWFIHALGIPVYEGYGLTEAGSVVTANHPAANKIGTVGRAMPGVTLSLDLTRSSGPPDEGELLVKSPSLMRGYHGMPEETAVALTRDGLRTGDLARIDAEGYVTITGRVKDLYKLDNAKYVSPAVLEERLTLSPWIAQALVSGANRPDNVALLVLNEARLTGWMKSMGVGTVAAALEHPALRSLITAELETANRFFKGYEAIKRFALLPQPFTLDADLLTPTLKVRRANIERHYAAELAALYPS